MCSHFVRIVSLLFVLVLHASVTAQIAVLPAEFQLVGPNSQQQLIVEHLPANTPLSPSGYLGQVSESVSLTSMNPNVVRIEGSVAIAESDGVAEIKAVWQNFESTAKVTVRNTQQSVAHEFTRHVLPVLSKAGCNTGACHGALAGKGGFKLSLRAYDPAGDHYAITRAVRGRRIELADPGRSLLLTKPTGALPHKGGLRLDVDSDGYRVLAEWIQAGAIGPLADDAKLVRIESIPRQVQLDQGQSQQILVTAYYSDGRQEDVTRWAKFSASDQTVLSVTDDGKVTSVGHGEGAVVVWFSSQIVLSRIVCPFPATDAENPLTTISPANFIDRLAQAKWDNLNLQPSPLASDEEFVRRVFLDTIGTLPTADEVSAFLQDNATDKRIRLIDNLLDRTEFVDYWTHKWSDLFLINGRRLRPKAVKAYYQWLRQHVEQNTPWDQLVTEVVTSKGSNIKNGATNFFALHQDPESMTENVCQAFLSLSIGCAKCHNHPLEKWTNDQYYAMANHFARVQAKGWGGDGRNGDGERTLIVVDQGELVQPLTGKPQQPTPLDGEPLQFDSPGDRRVHLANWLTSPENPYFARAITNRVWASFMGVGIVEPVDDLRLSNPASNEELLDSLSQYLVENDFDLKKLMRLILQSNTYQRTSRPIPANAADQRYFTRYYPKRLTAEVLLDAISQVTRVPSEFTRIQYDGNDFQDTSEYPKGTRAIQLYDSAVASDFLATFGRNDRDITCECERSNTPSMVQVLHINNGTTINARLQNDNSCVQQALQEADDPNSLIHQAYLRTLARSPTSQEQQSLLAIWNECQDDDQRRTFVEDLYWSIMSSREFLFNH